MIHHAASDSRYDPLSILLHWATAVLVVTQWLGAQVIDWFPNGPLRVDARSVHILFGLILAALIVARLFWRLTGGRRLPPAATGLLGLAAKSVHVTLYALLLAMVTVGVALTWTRGDSIFNLFSVPAFDPGNEALADQVQDIHATLGWLILGLAGLHAGIAILHRQVWRDRVFDRMLPAREAAASSPVGSSPGR